MHLRDDATLAYNINFPNEKHLFRVREGACHLLTPVGRLDDKYLQSSMIDRVKAHNIVLRIAAFPT